MCQMIVCKVLEVTLAAGGKWVQQVRRSVRREAGPKGSRVGWEGSGERAGCGPRCSRAGLMGLEVHWTQRREGRRGGFLTQWTGLPFTERDRSLSLQKAAGVGEEGRSSL